MVCISKKYFYKFSPRTSKIYEKKINDYDLFLYHEDDIPFKYSHVQAFITETNLLKKRLQPPRAAECNAVVPSVVAAFTSAPCSTNHSIAATWPSRAAEYNAVMPSPQAFFWSDTR